MNATGVLNLTQIFNRFRIRRGLLFGALIITALIAFETFNYSTTDYALSDLLGNLRFASIRWATILAIAFCGIDFAGIARLFTPEEGSHEPTEVWYLFGAWMLAATMNAMLTWWGVSLAILNHNTLSNAVIARQTLIRVVPVFVAIMVWLIRVLIIGTLSVAGDRLFSQANSRSTGSRPPIRSLGFHRSEANSGTAVLRSDTAPTKASPLRPLRRPTPTVENSYTRPEPTYHPAASMRPRSDSNENQTRR